MDDKPRTTPYPLRMPEELRAKLEESAKSGARSLHAEIVARLERSFDSDSSSGGLITVSMDEFDAVIESAVNRAVERAMKAGNR